MEDTEGPGSTMNMEDHYRAHWEKHRETILRRLEEFRSVPPEEYHYELLYCLLTPQSRAKHAAEVIERLRQDGWPEVELDPVPYLRDPARYIRFHNVKGARLLDVRRRRDEIDRLLLSEIDSREMRARLVEGVNGFGMKEASHFLRNIGHLDLAIIDRHILTHLERTGAIGEIPKTISKKRYLELENAFLRLAEAWGMGLQEVDLLFWSMEEGAVRK